MPSLFISDLHLSEDRPAANERFFRFVEHDAAGADALYVLGDLFEYWIGDEDLETPFNALIAGFLQRLADSGTRVRVMHGNRDFLLGEAFCEASGAQLLADPTVIDGTLLMHGDTLCTDDHDYQAWRRTARSAEWQRAFLAKPLGERRATVQGLRDKSKEVIQAKPAEIMDVNEGAVREALRRHGVARLIHGHTHRPGKHALELDGRRCERWVLPDWYGRGGYLELAGSRARLIRW
ncbi:MAG: UDP-2,3-diacylglucosamine diphosphatase [Betaproteobacteria bacterium]|nr:MAG: UDP-2,3-diacylglucosamine diphosphatase [Betaproteobacteria bacterium]